MPGAGHQIAPEELLSRYLFNPRKFDPSTRKVKYPAFLPNPNNGETSVFRTSSLPKREIWRIGDNIGERRKVPVSVLARGDVPAGHVVKSGLKIDPDKKSLHANIIGWPEEKSAQILAAMLLADKAQLYLR